MKVRTQDTHKMEYAQTSSGIEVSGDNNILKLIRSSVPKPEEAKPKGGYHVYKRKDSELDKLDLDKPLKKGKWKSNYELSPHIMAVRHVRSERMSEGLPAEVKEELESIEEEAVRNELRSSRKMDAKDKLHAAECKTIEDYLDTKTFTRRIANEMWANKVAKALVAWVKRPREDGKDPIKLTEFFMEEGIYHRDFHRLAKRYDVLGHAADFALKALGNIRERNVLENKWNAAAGMFMMGHYDDDWAAELRRREEAKQKQNAISTIDLSAIVKETIKPVAATEEVKRKKEEDERRRT